MHRDTGLPDACINMLFFANNAMEAPTSTYGLDNTPFDVGTPAGPARPNNAHQHFTINLV